MRRRTVSLTGLVAFGLLAGAAAAHAHGRASAAGADSVAASARNPG